MPLYITIDIRCSACEHTWDEMVERGQEEAEHKCSECGGSASRILSTPAVMREAYHMGYKRGDKYELNKQIARMKVEKANLPHDKRVDIDREISTLKKVARTKRDKTE